MKIKNVLLIAVVIVLSAAAAFAQIVVITPKKVVYQRPKASYDYKKSFTVIYPKVKNQSPALAKKIENSLSYQRIFNLNIREEINESQWLEEASYEVNYNKNGILGVMLTMSGSGAYPWDSVKSVIVDLKTGAPVTAPDVFFKLGELAAACRRAQQPEIKEAITEIKKDSPDIDEPASLFQDAKFNVNHLNEFSIDDRGVTFRYDYNFPRVLLSVEPEGHYFFNWSQLKPFIKRRGLLGKFVR